MSIQGATTREYVNNGKVHQQQVLDAQDNDLQEIDVALDGIHDVSKGINDELDDQAKLIDELNRDVATTQTAMDKVNASLLKMLNTKDGCQLGVVIAMSIICVISVILLVTAFV